VGSHLPTLPLIMPHVPSGSSSANIQTVRSNTICQCHSRNTLIILEMTGKNKAPSLAYIKVQVSGAESQSTVDCQEIVKLVDCEVLPTMRLHYQPVAQDQRNFFMT
jgi:hypothetical protein